MLKRFEWPDAEVVIECGRGTYIRSIARDVGLALGIGGYLLRLRRTRIGDYDVADAVTPDQLAINGIAAHLRP